MIRVLLLTIIIYLLLIDHSSAPSSCPSVRRLKPCECRPANSALVLIHCRNIRSWSQIKHVLHPFRHRESTKNRKLPTKVDILQLRIDRVQLRAREPVDQHLKRMFRWLTIGELIVKNSPISFDGRWTNGMFANSTIFSLTFDNCKITQFDSEIFASIGHLQELTLSNNLIGDISLTNTLPELRKLDLNGNKLTRIPQKFPYIEALYLSENGINQIVERDFIDYANLIILDLSNNAIGNIYANAFRPLRQLDFLSLAFNPLNEYNYEAVSELINRTDSQLVTIDLSGTRVQLQSLHSQKLETIIVQQRNVVDSNDICNLTIQNRQLETIELVYGTLRHIHPSSFRGGIDASLKSLKLSYNRLRYLPMNTFRYLRRLENLDLSHNFFADNFTSRHYPLNRPLITRSRSKLKRMQLAHNQLIIVPQRLINSLINLEELDVSGNKIRHIYATDFVTNKHLKKLDLHENCIEYIDPNAFDTLIKLRYLNLGGNQLQQLAASLHLPARLEVLQLNDNQFSTLDDVTHQIGALQYLRSINLGGNKLKTITTNTFDASKRTLVLIDLKGNRLNCSCELRQFVEFIVDNGISLSAETKCFYPDQLRGQALNEKICWSRCEKEQKQIDFCT